MSSKLKVGMKYTLEHTVREDETAFNYDSGAMHVYSTPAMIALMECAAHTMLMDAGLDNVGTMVNIEHKKACKPGTIVIAEALLTEIDGKRLTFDVKVTDQEGNILGEGTHGRYIIDPERFMQKVG
jgi:fluoroacetyl-CoA thioesterase